MKDQTDHKDVDKNYKTIPTEISALRIDWILNTEQGFIFLCGLFHQDNFDLYRNKRISNITDFIFQQSKARMIKFDLPLNIF